MAFSPDGALLACGYGDGTIRLWDPASGQPSGSALQAGSAVNGVAFSLDGKLLASADANGAVRVWNLASGQPSGSPLQAGSAVNGVAFSPDGKLASADASGAVRLWNTASVPPGGLSVRNWLILAAAVVAIALSVLAVTITTREIWLARK